MENNEIFAKVAELQELYRMASELEARIESITDEYQPPLCGGMRGEDATWKDSFRSVILDAEDAIIYATRRIRNIAILTGCTSAGFADEKNGFGGSCCAATMDEIQELLNSIADTLDETATDISTRKKALYCAQNRRNP